MQVVNATTGFMSFLIDYTVTASRSTDPSPVCNEIIVYNPSNQPVGSSEEICACPDGFVYCPIDGTCVADNEVCGFDKSITLIAGNVIYYRVDGYIDTGDVSATITDINTGAWFNDDFVLSVSQ